MSISSRYSNGPTTRNAVEAGPLPKANNSFVKRQNAIKRHSLPMGDNYVQLIGRVDANAAQQNGGIQSAIAARPSLVDIGRSTSDLMAESTPVVTELRTNVIIKDEFSLLTDLSQHLAAQYSKPSSSIMISLQHSTCLTLGGLSDPCYLLNVTAVPSRSHPVDNRRVAVQIQSFLADVLGVASGRGIILFHPMPAQNIAFQGVQLPKKADSVIADAEVVQMAQAAEVARDARRRSGDASWLSLPENNNEESSSDDNRPLRETLAALQGERLAANGSVGADRKERRKTLHAPPNLSRGPSSSSSAASDSSSSRKERRRTLNVPPTLPTIPSDNVSWSGVQERRRSLQPPPVLPTIPSPSLMPKDFGFTVAGPEDEERPTTSRGRSTADSKPRLDDPAATKAFAESNGKPARPKSMTTQNWSYERHLRALGQPRQASDKAPQRPKSSGGERSRPVDWRISQLVSPPTLHHPQRPTSIRSQSGVSETSSKKPRPLSLPSMGFLSSNRSPRSPDLPQSPPADSIHANHNFNGVSIPPVPSIHSAQQQRPNDRMRKRRSFVTALPQVESIPEVPPIPKVPEVVAVEPQVDDTPIKKRKSIFKIPFRRPTAKS